MAIRYHDNPFGKHKPGGPKGRVVIVEDGCKGCGFCVEYCPNDVLVLSSRYNVKGYHPPEVVHPDKCVNCGFCRMICPEFAIYTVAIEPETV
ncbi:4Fe-4S binding protein [bacterium]|nr:4Fe-4S binding protein [bacterium]